MLKLAVAGLGIWGQRHVRSARDSGCFEVVAAVDPDTERAQPIADELGLELHSSLDGVLSNTNIDAVTLATPHTLHTKQIVEAAKFGKHVYTEKPFALTADDARTAVSAAKKAGIKLALGHDQRHYPVIKYIRKMIADNKFGAILHAETNLSHGSTADLFKKFISKKDSNIARGWRLQEAEIPMGPISQFGIHRIDAYIHLFGNIEWVFAASSSKGIDPTFIDTLSINLKFESGVTGFIGNSVATPLHSSLKIFGSEVWVESSGPDTFAEYRECSLVDLVVFSEGNKEEHEFEVIDSVSHNFISFADSINGKGEFIISPEEMIHNIEVVDAIGISLQTGEKALVKRD